MIGIFGRHDFDRSSPVNLAAMAATIPAGYAVEAPAGIGAAIGRAAHRLDLGASAAASVDGQMRAVVVGEIDNVAELAAGLDGKPPPDAAALALVLAREDRWERLADANGLFAIAIYDRAAHRLTLVTDRLASYPLHIWRGDGQLVFAGQIYTLLAHPSVPRRADPHALAQLFTMQRTVGRRTSVAGVEALPAACVLQIDLAGRREKIYWRLRWSRPTFTRTEAPALLAQAMRRAVMRQTNGGRVGLLLSGGLDSRLVLAAAPRGAVECWTTASFAENPELAIARRIAGLFGAAHHPLIVSPADTLSVLDRTTIESNGLYPASTQMSVFLPTVGQSCDAVLTGHGLDYTLRGYYLPARFARLAGSTTRLPALRRIPAHPTGADVLANLRQGPPRASVQRIIAHGRAAEWWQSQAQVLQETLDPWLASEEPYNAWDAFILHAVSKHYAFTGMMSTRAATHLRIPAFDREVFGLYLQMPPSWRCHGRVVQQALRLLSPEAVALPNANTHFRAGLHPWFEVAGLLGRAALRRLGLAWRPAVPTPMHSAGSWQDLGALYREDPGHRRHFTAIRGRLQALTFGILNADGLATCIDEHLAGRAQHTKLLRQLLTHDAWVRCFGISGHA